MACGQHVHEKSGVMRRTCFALCPRSDYEYTQNMSFRQSNVFGSAAGLPPTATLPGGGSPAHGGKDRPCLD
eukprot:s2290_g10.t1